LYDQSQQLITPGQAAQVGLSAQQLAMQQQQNLWAQQQLAIENAFKSRGLDIEAAKVAAQRLMAGRGTGGDTYNIRNANPTAGSATPGGLPPSNISPSPDGSGQLYRTTMTPQSGSPWAPTGNEQMPDYLSGYTNYQNQPTNVSSGEVLPSWGQSQDDIWSGIAGTPSYGPGTAFYEDPYSDTEWWDWGTLY
jgi:hypothetical protein